MYFRSSSAYPLVLGGRSLGLLPPCICAPIETIGFASYCLKFRTGSFLFYHPPFSSPPKHIVKFLCFRQIFKTPRKMRSCDREVQYAPFQDRRANRKISMPRIKKLYVFHTCRPHNTHLSAYPLISGLQPLVCLSTYFGSLFANPLIRLFRVFIR